MNCFKPFHLLMAWLSPLPFVVPALAILMLLVLSEEPARFLYDTFSPLWVPSFFVLGGLNIALFTLRYFRRRDCLYVFLFSLLVAVSFVALPLMHKLIQDGSHQQRILNIVYYLVVSNGLFYCALNRFYYLRDRDRDRGIAPPERKTERTEELNQ